MSEIDIDTVVETFARMNLEQRDQFVKTLVYKWPHMAVSIKNMIDLQILIEAEKFRKEAENV